MNQRAKNVLIGLAAVATIGGGVWWWTAAMEQKWISRPHVSDAVRANRMLAATALLRQNGHAVTLAESVNALALNKLPDGALIVSDASGVLAPDQAKLLLDWVRRGNTLVVQPRRANAAELAQIAAAAAAGADDSEDEAEAEAEAAAAPGAESDAESDTEDDPDAEDESEDEAEAGPEDSAEDGETASGPRFPFGAARTDLVEVDPVAAYLGVRLYFDPADTACPGQQAKPPKPCTAAERSNKVHLGRLTLPGAAYALELAPDASKLASLPRAATPAWSDQQGSALRTYREGRGHIVMVADDYFGNASLQRNDHGELLLALARLNGGAGHVTLVKNIAVPRWYKALWDRYSLALSAIAVTLLLLLWRALRRFGPMLPEPNRERRSLLEHIDASGAWLWQAAGGRTLLLEAAREDTLALLRRRAPALLRLDPQAQNAALARLCSLPETEIDAALQRDTAPNQHEFIRQIRTLQILRNHYER